MSPSSTELYYSKLNTSVREALGGLHSADCIIRSVDFEEIAQLQTADRWDDAGELLGQAAAGLEAGGAEVLILATNTMHKVAPAIKRSITIPFIDIFSATAAAVVDAGCSRPLLMATAYTMEQDFCLDRLREAGLSPVVPNAEDRAAIHRIIFDELCKGAENGVFLLRFISLLCLSRACVSRQIDRFSQEISKKRDVSAGEIHEESRTVYETIAARYLAAGADSVILGCTEVGMLLHEGNVEAEVFDTAMIHCGTALTFALPPTQE
jgi:aspartate racemase